METYNEAKIVAQEKNGVIFLDMNTGLFEVILGYWDVQKAQNTQGKIMVPFEFK